MQIVRLNLHSLIEIKQQLKDNVSMYNLNNNKLDRTHSFNHRNTFPFSSIKLRENMINNIPQQTDQPRHSFKNRDTKISHQQCATTKDKRHSTMDLTISLTLSP